MKTIYAGLIAAVLLVSVSTTASAAWFDPVHWAPFDNGWDYFWGCTVFQLDQCAVSKWH